MNKLMMNKLMVLAVLWVAPGCAGLTPEAESALRDVIAADKGHMLDEDLPQAAREIAQDNHDACWDVLYHQGVESALPADVAARKAVRDAAKAGGK